MSAAGGSPQPPPATEDMAARAIAAELQNGQPIVGVRSPRFRDGAPSASLPT